MNEEHFDAEITRTGRAAADIEPITTNADVAVWNAAITALGERVYRTDEGVVRVSADWSHAGDDPAMRIPMSIAFDSATLGPRDVPAFVELFFHDVFLLFNLAVPGSFGGVITPAGGEYRTSELIFDAMPFEMAWVTASRNRWPAIAPLPLPDVIRWYDSLALGTRQLATNGVAKALFHLLHLCRAAESDATAVLRLAGTLEALFGTDAAALPSRVAAHLGTAPPLGDTLPRLFELRDAIAAGEGPALHPMQDDALDPQVSDAGLAWIDAADLAASIAVARLQSLVVTAGSA